MIYRSRTGDYDVPAIVTATVDTLHPKGPERYAESGGKEGVPPLSSDEHVHLTVFTPGIPNQRGKADDFLVESEHGRAENVGGLYQEWDIPFSEGAGVPGGQHGPGTWRFPSRV